MAVCPQHKSWEAIQTTVTDSSWFVWDFLGFSTESPLSWETPPVQGNWDHCSTVFQSIQARELPGGKGCGPGCQTALGLNPASTDPTMSPSASWKVE